jgi:hypothetical protein
MEGGSEAMWSAGFQGHHGLRDANGESKQVLDL